MPARLLGRRLPVLQPQQRCRRLIVLAIETSCDDTSVAVLHTPTPTSATLLFHETITSPNKSTGGIHPLLSLQSHRHHLAPLLARALQCSGGGTPDIVAVTRGPGMTASLAVGLDTAKGLSVALRRPLVGVNHMLGHALTPRLMAALGEGAPCAFPFLTLLVSGGHTLLLHSRALASHAVLAGTIDIALGDMLDKVARGLLPDDVMAAQGDTVAYGRLLEEFCFPAGEAQWAYHPPRTPQRRQETLLRVERWGDWKLSVPLAQHPRPGAFSFSGLGSGAQRVLDARPGMGVDERRALGREAMMVAFEHVASRIVAALREGGGVGEQEVAVVVSGGVASNMFLRHLLTRYLENEGFHGVRLVVPPMKYCTDQAAMIAWAGAELWRAGWRTDLAVTPIRKWSLDDDVPSEEGETRGGVLGVSGWIRRE